MISVDDQIAITDTLSHYAWSLDRGDSDGVVACFTPTGSVVTDWGQPIRHEGAAGIRGYYEGAMRSSGFQGRQHHIRPISFEPSGANNALRPETLGRPLPNRRPTKAHRRS